MKKGRLLSLDVFRGMTMASMILVENPGNWSIYRPFRHAAWGSPMENGLPFHEHITPTDLIFPFFIFIMGVAIPFALGRKRETVSHSLLTRKIILRFLSLFAIGLFFYAYPSLLSALLYKTEIHVRIPGVLQRIALVYLICSVLFLKLDFKKLIYVCIITLLVYWAVITLIPVPGYGKAAFIRQWFEPDGIPKNLANWIDTKVFGYGDPEGILTSFTAIVSGLSGVLCGMWLGKDIEKGRKAAALFAFGTILAAAGWIWGQFFPIIKDLWTSSYVLVTTGLGMLGLATCYWFIDVNGRKKGLRPFIAFGMNSLAVYVGSHIVMSTLRVVKIADDCSIHDWIMSNVFESWLSPMNASLAFAFLTVCFWLIPLLYLEKRKIYIKV